jgi:hypothetical protein
VTRNAGFRHLPSLCAALLTLTVFAAAGCSGEPSTATTAGSQLFSQEELDAMRKSVNTPREFRALLKIKTAEREGTAVVKTKQSAGKSKR